MFSVAKALFSSAQGVTAIRTLRTKGMTPLVSGGVPVARWASRSEWETEWVVEREIKEWVNGWVNEFLLQMVLPAGQCVLHLQNYLDCGAV